MKRFLSAAITLATFITLRLSGQATLVRSNDPPKLGAVPAVKVATMGVLDGAPEYALGHVSYVTGERSGGFFIYDAKSIQIRRYSADGKFLSDFGRKGSGPGEYSQVTGMGMIGDTALVVWDPRNSRVTFFGMDGKVRNSYRPTLGSSTYGPDVFGVDNAGIVSIQSGIGKIRKYIRYKPNGVLLDTLSVDLGESTPGMVLMMTDGPRFSFKDDRIAKPSPLGGVITATTSKLGFTLRTGGKVITVQRNFTPIPLGAEERKEWEAYAADMYARQKAQPPQPNVRAPEPRAIPIPAMKPAIRDLRVDPEGQVWLDVYIKAEKRTLPPPTNGSTRPRITWRENTVLDVFLSSGTYLRRIILPPEHEVYDARGDFIWTIAIGPDGEERVVVFRAGKG